MMWLLCEVKFGIRLRCSVWERCRNVYTKATSENWYLLETIIAGIVWIPYIKASQARYIIMNTEVIRLAKSNIVIAICIKSFYSVIISIELKLGLLRTPKECLDLFNEESTERSSDTVSNLLLGRRRYVRSLALFAFLAAFFGSIIRPMITKAIQRCQRIMWCCHRFLLPLMTKTD